MCLPSGSAKNSDRRGLLLAGFVADQNDDLADAFDRSLQDGPNLPDAAVVVTPTGMEECIDGLFGGRSGGKFAGSGLGKTGAADGRGRRRAGAGVLARPEHPVVRTAGKRAGTRGQRSCAGKTDGQTDQADSPYDVEICGKLLYSLYPRNSLYLNFNGDGKSAPHAKRL